MSPPAEPRPDPRPESPPAESGPVPGATDPGRVLGFRQLTGIGVAAIVGGGIFVLGGVAVAEAGPAAALAFALNGVIALLTAAAFAELATAFPENGGQYAYARRTFSVRTAFGVGWIMVFAHIVAAVLYALGFAAYAVGALGPLFPDEGIPGTGLLRGLTLMLALAATGAYGFRLTRGAAAGGQLENLGKLAVFGVLIAAGLAVILQRGPAEALAPLTPFMELGFTGVIAAMGFTFITMQGFELIAGVAGEAREPRRDLPRAMFTSLGIALAIYLPLLLIVTSVGLAPGEASPAAMAARLPDTYFAVAAGSYLGSFGFWLVTVAAILSTLTALRANLLAGSRIVMAMARHRTLPRQLERLSPKHGAPVTAILFVCVSVGVLVLIVPDLAAAGAASSLVFLLTFGFTHLCAWQIRRRAGGALEGAFATPLFPLVPMLGMLFCGGLIAFQAVTVPTASLLLLVWAVLGTFVYLGFLAARAEALDARVEGEDPLLSRLRGHRTSVLVPLANPARAGGLASVAAALAPPQVGRVLLHQVIVADPSTGEDELRHAMSEGNAALGNALLRTREAGVETELLLTVSPDPWREILRTARSQQVSSVLLGLSQAPGGAAHAAQAGSGSHPLDHLVAELPCEVALLHAPDRFDLRRIRSVLVPLSGKNDHDRLRARVIGSLARQGADALTFMHVIDPKAPRDAATRAASALRRYVQDEARGRGEALVVTAEDPVEAILERAAGADLLLLGITRPRGGTGHVGGLLARMIRESPCPVLLISHPSTARSGRPRPF